MRSITRIALSAVVCSTFVAVSTVSAAEVKFDKVEYFPPKVEGQKKGADPVKGHVIFDKEKKVVEFQDNKGQMIVTIPYDKIKTLLYEKTSKPRYTEAILISPFFLFSKTKKHFLTIQYTDPAGTGAFFMIHMDKSNASDIANTAQAETGKPVERTEER
jgi:hypothetical protein